MNPKITIAKDTKTNQAVHISAVKNGLSCGCICWECSQAMVAANKGKIQQHHFRHYRESNCLGAPETGLHLLAKKILLEANVITISEGEDFRYTNSSSEKKYIGIIPDITLEDDNEEIWLVEIAVTHPLEEQKIESVQRLNVNCLELDLKKVKRDITPKELRRRLLYKLSLRKIIHRKIYKLETFKDQKVQEYWIVVAFAFIIFLFGFGRRKTRRKNRLR